MQNSSVMWLSVTACLSRTCNCSPTTAANPMENHNLYIDHNVHYYVGYLCCACCAITPVFEWPLNEFGYVDFKALRQEALKRHFAVRSKEDVK